MATSPNGIDVIIGNGVDVGISPDVDILIAPKRTEELPVAVETKKPKAKKPKA